MPLILMRHLHSLINAKKNFSQKYEIVPGVSNGPLRIQ